MRNIINEYFSTLGALPSQLELTDRVGRSLTIERVFDQVIALARQAHDGGYKLMFIGNGGSSTIASHMAEDFSKAANIRAIAFNDPAFLTCLGNDLGFDQVFAKQIELFAKAGDLLVAISSSGNSQNILNAVLAARDRGCSVVTLSGFGPDNSLRGQGDYNIYVPNSEYGFVEITHSAICHAILDIAMGWRGRAQEAPGPQEAPAPRALSA